ncbi:MAG TPA: A24 family peptidase [Steroidobacteraceae bacterium]|nr:A24 family peptidase [Steroidobacteraceae bacterium]
MLELLAQSPAAFVAVALALGLVVGSFLNVVIYRLPIMLERQWQAESAAVAHAPDGEPSSSAAADQRPFNLVQPRSRCPACQAPISAIHNIPVLSYLALRGRCAHCKVRISARYPAVELLSGVATALVAWRFGFGWAAACAMVVTWFLIALTFIDLDVQLLPDSLTLPLLWLGLVASLTGWSSSATSLPSDPVSAIGGAAIGYLSLWALYHLFRLLTGKEGMGHGDFKLLAALGAWLGWQMLLPIVLLSAGVGAIIGVALIAMRRQQRGNPIPFGPFLAAAGWVSMLWGPQMVARYLGLFAPYR